MSSKHTTFDTVSFIMDYEQGNIDADDLIVGFQYLIDSGMAWTLQGHYGRVATQLIERGYCHATPVTH